MEAPSLSRDRLDLLVVVAAGRSSPGLPVKGGEGGVERGSKERGIGGVKLPDLGDSLWRMGGLRRFVFSDL